MGKSKLGRVRKYSNRVYQQPSESATHDTATATPNADLLGHLPYQFLFSPRNVAPAVLHQPSVCNYSRVFTILSNEGVFRNQWNLIKHSELFLMLCTFSTRGITPVPERTVIVNTDLTWRVIACNSSANDSVLNTPKHLVTLDSFLLLLDLVDKCNVCPGIQNDNLVKLSMTGGRNGEFKDLHGNTKARLLSETIRTVNCSGLTLSNICEPCKSYKKVLLTMYSNEKSHKYFKTEIACKTSPTSHCAWKHLCEKEKEERIKNCRQRRQSATRKISRLEEKFKEDLITLSEADNAVVEELFKDMESRYNHNKQEDFKSLFVQQQKKALMCSDSRARRWHPLIIRWCFELHSTSPKAYQLLKESGVLILPDKRTLRDYSNCFKVDSGFDLEFLDSIKRDFNERSNPKDYDVWVGVIHDEVSLRKDLVFDDSGKLIGFVNLGTVQNSIDDLEQCLSSTDNTSITPEQATHMFVFMAVSLFSDWKMPVAFFPTTTIKSFALFNLFWKCVENLEERGFKVLTSTCDGASPHRKFYKFHCPPGAPKGTLIYKTNNPFADEVRPLYFVCDPVHLLKTTRNNWENSCWRNKTKKLKNNGMWITWLQLIDAFENDVNASNASGLRLLHKLTADHLFLNPYLRMRVYLAAQVFSNRVALALQVQGKPGTEETKKFVENMNNFFDCLNANKICTQFEFKSVYRTPLDRRLHWLENDFLNYFQDWRNWALSQEDVPLAERKQYFVSDQTWEGLQICVKSFVEVVKFSLTIPGVSYVVATKLNQDPLEKFFGKLRQKRGAYGAFTCKEFTQNYSCAAFSQSHAIKTVRRIKRSGGALESLDADLQLPKQRK